MPGEIYDNKQLIVNKAVHDTYNAENPDWSDKVINNIKTLLNGRAEQWYKNNGMNYPLKSNGPAELLIPESKLAETYKFMDDTIERISKDNPSAVKPSNKVQIRTYDPQESYFDKYIMNDKNTAAFFNSATNDVTLKPADTNFGVLNHEINGHWLRHNINPYYKPMGRDEFEEIIHKYVTTGVADKPTSTIPSKLFSDNEKNQLLKTYSKVFESGQGRGNLEEMGAVNTQLRSKVSERNGHILHRKLDEAIDNDGENILIDLIFQPYTNPGVVQEISRATGIEASDIRFITRDDIKKLYKQSTQLQDFINSVKETMKVVGCTAPIAAGSIMYNREKRPYEVTGSYESIPPEDNFPYFE